MPLDDIYNSVRIRGNRYRYRASFTERVPQNKRKTARHGGDCHRNNRPKRLLISYQNHASFTTHTSTRLPPPAVKTCYVCNHSKRILVRSILYTRKTLQNQHGRHCLNQGRPTSNVYKKVLPQRTNELKTIAITSGGFTINPPSTPHRQP